MKDVLVSAVADEFADTSTVLKQFASAASAPLNTPNRLVVAWSDGLVCSVARRIFYCDDATRGNI